ncbi:WxL domain-containing protein [Actinocorallia aurantiaca]|uniref:WxL domain-containing protein n=1 Tax=Actinocorallia aurantiaca TaxID=46204 RepID=A0ABN3UP56_9ACTN
MRHRALPILLGAGLAVFGLSSPALAAGPGITVDPSSGADPAGQTLTVNGSGFTANALGVYVSFGPKNADYHTNANAYQKTKWVRVGATPSAGQDVLKADGTFSTTLEVSASYTDGDGNAVDCLKTQCYVLTFAAHGSADRSQDTFIPVNFTGQTTDPGTGEPGTGNPGNSGSTAEQTITAEVSQGGSLSLSVAGQSVTLSSASRGGNATGALNTATVTDTRGTDAGWSLVGQVGDFTSTEGRTIPGSNLSWTPSAASTGDGSQGQATPGQAVTGLDQARTLGSAEGGLSGGIFDLGAALDLKIPAGASTGTYTGTLTLTLS